jgi:hypothetical protein
MRFPHVLFILLALTALAVAQEKPAKPEKPKPAAPADVANDLPSQVASIFFGLLQKGEIDSAYEGLTKGSKVAERPEELRTLKTKTREAIDVFGPVKSYELVESKTVGTALLRRTYLSLNKEFPLRWRFYFYLSDNVWRLIDLRVDDRITGMFDEADEPRAAAPEAK